MICTSGGAKTIPQRATGAIHAIIETDRKDCAVLERGSAIEHAASITQRDVRGKSCKARPQK
jgi:hypothetical protein